MNRENGAGWDDIESVPTEDSYAVEDGGENDNIAFSSWNNANQEGTDTTHKHWESCREGREGKKARERERERESYKLNVSTTRSVVMKPSEYMYSEIRKL